MNNEKSKLDYLYDFLSPKIRNAIFSISEMERMRLQEIRMRLNKKLTVTAFGKEYYVTADGRLMTNVLLKTLFTAFSVKFPEDI